MVILVAVAALLLTRILSFNKLQPVARTQVRRKIKSAKQKGYYCG
jgi:hypothetical protein